MYYSTFSEAVPRAAPGDRMKSDWSTQTPKAKGALSWVCSVEIPFVRDTSKLFHTRAKSGHSY